MGRSTDDHKSLAKYPSRHGLVWVSRDGYRDMDMEAAVHKTDGLFGYADRNPVVRLDLDANGIEFLAQYLPEDGFTDIVIYLRDLAKRQVEQGAWDAMLNA